MRSSSPRAASAATMPTVIPATGSTAAVTAATAGPRTSAAARATRTGRCSPPTFSIPNQPLRFVEIAAAALGRRDGDAAGVELLESGPEPELELDEDLLR